MIGREYRVVVEGDLADGGGWARWSRTEKFSIEYTVCTTTCAIVERSRRCVLGVSGERMRAWDTLWGHGTAKIVIEDSYVNISESVITDGASEIRADGMFSLGYPRRDNGEEINARIFISPPSTTIS